MATSEPVVYEDVARKMNGAAITALLKSAGADWNEAKKSAAKAAEIELFGLNLLRRAGESLREAANREQVSFSFFNAISDRLPKDMDFRAIKFCVHLARTFPNKIESLDELKNARQLMFIALGEIEAPRRIEEQESHSRNFWSEFINWGASFSGYFQKLAEEPMDKWCQDKLLKFLESTEPIVKKHEEAKQLFKNSARHD